MKLVRTGESFDHLASLQIVQANCATILALLLGGLLLLEHEAGDGIDDVLYFFRRRERLAVFINLGILLAVLVLLVVLLLEVLPVVHLELGTILRHSVEVKLLVVVAARELVARSLPVGLLLLLLAILEYSIEVHLDAGILSLNVR